MKKFASKSGSQLILKDDGKYVFKMSKSEWKRIGKEAGWVEGWIDKVTAWTQEKMSQLDRLLSGIDYKTMSDEDLNNTIQEFNQHLDDAKDFYKKWRLKKLPMAWKIESVVDSYKREISYVEKELSNRQSAQPAQPAQQPMNNWVKDPSIGAPSQKELP